MNQEKRTIVVFGAAGFIGRMVVQKLAERGFNVRAIVSDPQNGLFLRTMGEVGQVCPLPCNFKYPESLDFLCHDAYGIVNLIGVLFEKGSRTFEHVHSEIPQIIAKAAHKAQVKKLVHISAIGADLKSSAPYSKSKAMGEKNVRLEFPHATIIRPSIVFGPRDRFFNRFAEMAKRSSLLVSFGKGLTKFQPVYVGDVAQAIVQALESETTQGKTYELAGSKIYSFNELMQLTMTYSHCKAYLLHIPKSVGKFFGHIFKFLPNPPFTPEQVDLLDIDNIASAKALGLKDLGIKPHTVEEILPKYLEHFRGTF